MKIDRSMDKQTDNQTMDNRRSEKFTKLPVQVI